MGKNEDFLDKQFTGKQTLFLVSSVIIVIAFLETSGALWSRTFWKDFLLNIFIYSAVSIVASGLFLWFMEKK